MVISSYLLTQHELGQLLDEDMDEAERDELREAEEVCKRFLGWDLSSACGGDDDVKGRLGRVLVL